MESYGYYEKLWQFSSFFIQKGFEVLEVSNADTFLDGDIQKTEPCHDNIILRAYQAGRPTTTTMEINSVNYHAIEVGGKAYVPDKERRAE